MTIVEVLLIVTFNLLVSFGLIAILYYLAIRPLQKQIESKASTLNQNTQQKYAIPAMKRPDNVLPDMEDLPDDAFWGEDEPLDYKTTPEDMEQQLTEGAYKNYNAPRTNSYQQLKGLNPNGSI
jgi:hypothetical protein